MPVSRLDAAYRSLVISKFFNKGWGKPENLKKLFEFRKVVSKRETCFPLVDTDYPVTITKERNYADSSLLEGQFLSPFEHYLPGLLPQVSETAYFQVLIPKKWQSSHYKPVCLHLAGTGDHFFFRRRNLMAKPLIKEAGIGALLLENPFYGLRKPKDQRWSALHNVSDIFVMGGCLILETLVLFHWCKRNGLGPFGLTGISMGGHMASLAATNIPEPIVLVPCLSWTTASGVFTKGVMSSAINWELLEHQYFSEESYSKEIKHMVKIIDNHECFAAGQHFAKNYPESLNKVEKLAYEDLNGLDENEKGRDRIKSVEVTRIVRDEDLGKDLEKDLGKENVTSRGEYQNVTSIENSRGKRTAARNLERAKNRVSDYLLKRSRDIEEHQSRARDGKENSQEERNNGKTDREKQEALQFMCGIMDECTHLKNFSIPVDTELIISVTAKDDGYVPRDGLTDLQDLWRGSEVRYLNSGHIGAFLLHQKFFRLAIIDAFEKLKGKYFKNERKSAEVNGKRLK